MARDRFEAITRRVDEYSGWSLVSLAIPPIVLPSLPRIWEQPPHRSAERRSRRILLRPDLQYVHRNLAKQPVLIDTGGPHHRIRTRKMLPLKFLQRRFNSTIFSLSSGFGKCGVAVIRISGPSTKAVIQQMTSIRGDLEPRFAYYKNIHSPSHQEEILDKGLVLWFPGKSPIPRCTPPHSDYHEYKLSFPFQVPKASRAKTVASSRYTGEQR